MLYTRTSELYHHGIKGQKWGIRRYQNEDGTLTEAGKARYGADSNGNIVNRDLYKKDRIKIATKDARKLFFEDAKKIILKNSRPDQDAITHDLVEKYGQEIADVAEIKARRQIIALVSAMLFGQ